MLIFIFFLECQHDHFGASHQEQEIQKFIYLLTLVISYVGFYDETRRARIIEIQIQILSQIVEELKTFHDLPEAEMGEQIIPLTVFLFTFSCLFICFYNLIKLS